MANFSDRRMTAPFGLYKTIFGDTDTNVRNAHNFVDASWTHEIGKASSLRIRFQLRPIPVLSAATITRTETAGVRQFPG
jgi:hypothetical protein